MEQDLFYQIALTMVPGIGPVSARKLLDEIDAQSVFRQAKSTLMRVAGLEPDQADAIRSFTGFPLAEKELQFTAKQGIRALSYKGDAYPRRLKECADAPVILYYKGTADLNQHRVLAIVGTRKNTHYGKQVTEQLIDDLRDQQILIVSGLAHGIDSLAHRFSIKNKLETVAVLGHGLHQIYPAANHGLAKEILNSGGGLLSEYPGGVGAEPYHFPARNRIVAGISDAVVVVESLMKGGSLITADLANGYNREVFAVPGRLDDLRSSGTNAFIRSNKAALLDGASSLMNMLNWAPAAPLPRPRQSELFVDLTPDESTIIRLLRESGIMSIDELNMRSGLGVGLVAGVILSLELRNQLLSLPGKRYKLPSG